MILSQPVVWSTSILELVAVVALLPTLAAILGHLLCHQSGCFRLGRFQYGHFRLCRIHHPKVPSKGKITAQQIKQETMRQIRRGGS